MMTHCSFDVVNEFVPRIPEQRCTGEDDTIERICVAPTIIDALNAIPQAGIVVENMQKLGLPVIIHVYYLKADKLMENSEVRKYVPDACTTGESWILEKPYGVFRIDYEIMNCKLRHTTDSEGQRIVNIICPEIKRVKHQSNVENFVKKYGKHSKSLFEKFDFRTILSNFEPEWIEKLR